MFETLHIQGYRRFKDYRLENLARVNLLVGDNNSGKTSVLEAVHLLALNDPHAVFELISQRRGERVFIASERKQGEGHWYPTLKHCFSDHELDVGKRIRIGSPGTSESGLEIELIRTSDAPARQLLGRMRLSMAVRFKSDFESDHQYFGIDAGGVFDSTIAWDPRDRTRIESILLDLELSTNALRGLWNHVNETGHNSRVIDALRTINDDLDRIHFDAIGWPPINPRTGVKVGLTHRTELVPIGSLGQGVYRMLELAVGLVASEDGVFLIDEIDNGFHWSRMAEIWKFVIETAKATNTQVFATTHSEDCIKGLASVCSEHPELAEEVSVQSLKTALDFSVSVTGDRLPFVVGQEIEVR